MADELSRWFRVVRRIACCVIVLLVACDMVPRKVAMNDPRIQPLLQAAQQFDRTAYGFTPIPQNADVRWESRSRSNYDAMLHITGKTSRTIAFVKAGSGWRWAGDQEVLEGPKMFKTVDGTFKEHITLTYETENISGAKKNQLNIDYSGEDPRLANKRNLTLSDVEPILKEWGY